MEDFKVSVVVPAYNLENYITKTLKSLENQTYKNMEVLVVNDGSKDSTARVAREYLSKTKLEYKYLHNDAWYVSETRVNFSNKYVCTHFDVLPNLVLNLFI